VLVVEDTADVRFVLAHMLERAGYRVLQANNGEQALGLLADRLPDLVLMDLAMPRLDGWSALARLRQLAGGAALPVIAVTAHAMPGDRERAIERGFDEYVTKPLDLPGLLALVARLLGR
jgi:CheY-like chemotaxis protein